ncbi:MAG TPA: hypothetical protein VFT66_24555 [Roseiflexaceae bacterium]|jgi:hypothetical protein|nr:hypothetical protein [Roseiflexaceae bacterium]
MEAAMNLGTIGAVLGSAACFTNLTVSGITMAFPKWSSWLAFSSALLLGIFYAALLSIANGMLLNGVPTGQAIAQVLLVGSVAGGAAGATITHASAMARRQDAIGQEHTAAPANISSVAAANG